MTRLISLAVLVIAFAIGVYLALGRNTRLPGPTQAGAIYPDQSLTTPSVDTSLTESRTGGATATGRQEGAKRQAIEKARLTGRVINSSGQGIEGAIVSITGISESSLSDYDGQTLIEEWKAHSEICTTSRDGFLRFDVLPKLESGWQIWVTHPRYRSLGLADPELGSDLGTLQMTPADVRNARVISRSGEPIEGAETYQVCYEEAPSLRSLVRWSESDGLGLCSLNGPGTPLRESVLALANGLRSPWNHGSADRPLIELTLHAEYIVSGQVDGVEFASADLLPFVIRYGPDFQSSISVRPDGSFGPAALAAVSDEQVFRLTGGGAVPQDRVVRNPAEGTVHEIHFTVEPGIPQWFLLLSEDGAPLPGGFVILRWSAGVTAFSMERHARQDGYVYVPDCRPGRVEIQYRCPGHATQTETVNLPLSEEAALAAYLQPITPLHGRVFGPEGPCRDFSLAIWPSNDPRSRERYDFVDAENGYFEVADARIGLVELIAFSDTFAPSPVLSALVQPDALNELELQLRSPGFGKGRVIDRQDSAPVADADVAPHAANGAFALEPLGQSTKTDADGRFEVSGLSPDTTMLVVSAPGFAKSYVKAEAGAHGMTDLGVIALDRLQELRIQLHSSSSMDYSKASASTNDQNLLPIRHFSPGGLLTYLNVQPGRYELNIDLREGQTRTQTIDLIPGEDWIIDVDVGDLFADVTVTRADGSPSENGLLIMANARDRLGRQWYLSELMVSGNTAHLGPFQPGRVMFRVREPSGGSWTTLATVFETLVAGGQNSFELRIPEHRSRFRLVDPDGAPVAGATLSLFSPGVYVLDSHGATSATDGSFDFPELPRDRAYRLSVYHAPSRAMATSIPVELPVSPADTAEVVLDASRELSVRILDGDTPVSGARCAGLHPEFPQGGFFLRPVISNDAGLASWNRLGPGSFLVVVDGPGIWPTRKELSPSPTPHILQVRRRGDLLLQARAAGGLPVQGSRFRLRSADLDADVSAWVGSGAVSASDSSLETSAEGVLRIEGLPHGAYAWQASRPGAEDLRGEILVRPAELTEVVVEFP